MKKKMGRKWGREKSHKNRVPVKCRHQGRRPPPCQLFSELIQTHPRPPGLLLSSTYKRKQTKVLQLIPSQQKKQPLNNKIWDLCATIFLPFKEIVSSCGGRKKLTRHSFKSWEQSKVGFGRKKFCFNLILN